MPHLENLAHVGEAIVVPALLVHTLHLGRVAYGTGYDGIHKRGAEVAFVA